VHDIRISPGLTTTLLLHDSRLQARGFALEGREHFERAVVAEDRRSLLLQLPRGGPVRERYALTLFFEDGLSPTQAQFELVVHPTVAERQVEIHRHTRTPEFLESELEAERERTLQCQEREQHCLAREGPQRLRGIVLSGLIDASGIPALELSKSATLGPGEKFRLERVVTLQTTPLRQHEGKTPLVRLGVWVSLENQEGAKILNADRATLVGPRGEELETEYWQQGPIPPGTMGTFIAEVEIPKAQVQGTYRLKLWTRKGLQTLTLGRLLFPGASAQHAAESVEPPGPRGQGDAESTPSQ
jgi:uncharacterized protein (TIGR02268 family)